MSSAETPKAKKPVFIVEDDVFLVKTYQLKLQREGIEAWVASNGQDALAYLEKDPPGVVLLDLMLPQVSGFDILAAIRKNEKWKKVPVLVLTNLGQAQDAEHAKELGATDYIVKANVRLNDVVAKVKQLL